MASETIKEGTTVKILRYESRPEFENKEAEIGNYSEKDSTYECWLTDDALEGTYALCKREDFEIVVPEAPAPGEEPTKFCPGDRVSGKDSGKMGTVVSVDPDGDPKIKLDEEDEALQRFGNEFEVVEKGKFEVGDRVKGLDSGKIGSVVSVDEDGDPKVKLDGDVEAKQRFGKEFEIVEKNRKSASRSRGKDKKGKKSKKKKGSSSSDSGSSSSSSSKPQAKKRKSAFGRSTLEKLEDEKKLARQAEKKAGKGADAALRMFGLG